MTEQKISNIPQADGVLVLFKPKGITSASLIAAVKRGLGQKKIGHAGTLDPMAEGVLLVLLGQATKISNHLMANGEKVYSGLIRLGQESDTWDAEGKILAETAVPAISNTELEQVFSSFIGTYEQEVPAYSAAKHQGKPLYELARKGLATPVKSKIITISRGEAELVSPERVAFRVTCSSGTYIRSLAHSLGKRLGCGGLLEKLTREYSHPFGLDSAFSLESVQAAPEQFADKVQSISAALPGWPKLVLSEKEEALVRNGTRLSYSSKAMSGLMFEPGIRALFLNSQQKTMALAETTFSGGTESWGILRGLWN